MGIQKRTVYVGQDADGIFRPSDWAKVTTTLGTMVEPGRQMFQTKSTNTPQEDVDRGDEISRVDIIDIINPDAEMQILSGCDCHLHGGVCIPRDGR